MTTLQLLIAVAVSHVLFLTFIAVSSAHVVGKKAIGSIQGDFIYPMTLKFVGVADGKSYFAEVNQTMNRTEAAAYCHESLLKLASIETQEQADMLNQMLTELGFAPQYYWTSGKETQKDSMFKWNETEAQVNSSLVAGGWSFVTPESSCIYFYAHNTSSRFAAYPCTYTRRPLCHT